MYFNDNGLRAGLTLIEVLAVVSIIAFLMGIGGLSYLLARRNAKEVRAKAHLEMLSIALDEYRVEFGAYPVQTSGADCLTLSEYPVLQQLVKGVVGLDPWGRAYQYKSRSSFGYELWSHGPDEFLSEDDIYALSRGL